MIALWHTILLWAYPAELLVAGIEGGAYKRLRGYAFSWRDYMSSLWMSLGLKISGVMFAGISMLQYKWFWNHRLFDISIDTWAEFILLVLFVDFFYYWHHRLSHTIRWLWASHAPHHSSTHIDFAAAYRFGWTSTLTGANLLFAPLVFLGLSPKILLTAYTVNLTYQFWAHSEWIPKLGWLDKVFNTPSNHRVHHAINPEYLDKNYGGILIIYDRIFGTYQAERDDIKIRYGLVDHAPTNNVFLLAFEVWIKIFKDYFAAKTPDDRFHALFGKPAWKPADKID